MEPPSDGKDLISELPNDCLSLILQRLRHRDLKSCNLVCGKWFFLQGQSRQCLTLSASWLNTSSSIPRLFSRFQSVTKLVLRVGSHPKDFSDKELELISINCSNLTTLKLQYLHYEYATEVGMAALGTHAKRLKKLSLYSCPLKAKALNAFLSHSSSLEAISLYNFRTAMQAIYPGAAASSLKSISLKCITDNLAEWYGPFIVGSKKLTSLKIYPCLGDWSDVLNMVGSRDNCLFEVYLKVEGISDVAVEVLSSFSKLEILHVTSDFLSQSLNDEALISISTKCLNLKTLRLAGQCHSVTHVGMAALGKNAKRLKKFWCRNCKFGTKGLNALISNSSSLRVISVNNLKVNSREGDPCVVGSSSLKYIRLKDLCENQCQCFAPLITGSKNLTSLRLLGCSGNWDNVFSTLAMGKNSLHKVYLNKVQVTDTGLSALLSFSKLKILHLYETPKCTIPGIISVLEQCKSLRRLHVEESRMKQYLGDWRRWLIFN